MHPIPSGASRPQPPASRQVRECSLPPGDLHRQCATGDDFWLPEAEDQHPLALNWWEKLLLLAVLFTSAAIVCGLVGYFSVKLAAP